MILTADNYFSTEMNQAFWSVSQFKEFQNCEAAAMASIRGEYERPTTTALLQGSYVDAHFSGTMDAFLTEHPEILNSRTGELKADYVKARAAIERAEADEMFMEYCSGERQVIMTGEVFGRLWKVKADFLHPDKIVDMKYMRSMEPVYMKNEWKTFIDAYGYDLQGFIYQSVIAQNIDGELLPFYLAVITKEENPDLAIIHLPQWKLNSAGELMKHWIERYDAVKSGDEEPKRCSKCPYCRATKKLTKVLEYEELLED